MMENANSQSQGTLHSTLLFFPSSHTLALLHSNRLTNVPWKFTLDAASEESKKKGGCSCRVLQKHCAHMRYCRQIEALFKRLLDLFHSSSLSPIILLFLFFSKNACLYLAPSKTQHLVHRLLSLCSSSLI